MDPHSQQRIAQLAPKFGLVMIQLVENAAAESIDLRVTQALRSWNMQEAYWLQGRDTLEIVNAARAAVSLAPIQQSENNEVTKAAPGHGWHEYGMAGDVAPFDLHGQPDWNEAHPAWLKVIQMGEALGLKSGSTFRTIKDGPHFQPSTIPDSPTDEDRQNFKDGGMIVVWKKYQLV